MQCGLSASRAQGLPTLCSAHPKRRLRGYLCLLDPWGCHPHQHTHTSFRQLLRLAGRLQQRQRYPVSDRYHPQHWANGTTGRLSLAWLLLVYDHGGDLPFSGLSLREDQGCLWQRFDHLGDLERR